jgi:hypothetical protein
MGRGVNPDPTQDTEGTDDNYPAFERKRQADLDHDRRK